VLGLPEAMDVVAGHLIMLALDQGHGLLSTVPHHIEVDTVHDHTLQYLGEDMITPSHLETDTTGPQPTPMIEIVVVYLFGGLIHHNALEMGRRYLLAMGNVIQYLDLHPFKEILNLLLPQEDVGTQALLNRVLYHFQVPAQGLVICPQAIEDQIARL
jgi:hypothetical protein